MNKPATGTWRVDIPATELGNGIYILQVQMKNWKSTRKIVKQ
jgi:hypothetical protein